MRRCAGISNHFVVADGLNKYMLTLAYGPVLFLQPVMTKPFFFISFFCSFISFIPFFHLSFRALGKARQGSTGSTGSTGLGTILYM